MIEKLLIIGDPHAHPEYDNDRFEWLGRFIFEERPTTIVCMGDFADMPSLSSYDKGKKSYEGRRYLKDVQASIDAQEKLWTPVNNYNKSRKSAKKGGYHPRRLMLLGNHEDRINRAVNDDPGMCGTLDVSDLRYTRYGWDVIPYKSTFFLEGVAFAHHFSTGVSGRPLGGENIGRMLLQKNYMSSVVGHSHVFDHSERSRVDGRKLFGMSVGCYVHEDMVEGWNMNTVHLWWRGIVVLEKVRDGYYDKITTITARELRSQFS